MNLFFKFKNKTKFRFLQKSKIYNLNKYKNFTSEMCEITKLGKKVQQTLISKLNS